MTATAQVALQPIRGIRTAWRRFTRGLGDLMPKGLFARSLIIIIAPVVLLQALVAFVFMEEHWQQVTARLSAAVVADIAAVVDLLELNPGEADGMSFADFAAKYGKFRFDPSRPLSPGGETWPQFKTRSKVHIRSSVVRRTLSCRTSNP